MGLAQTNENLEIEVHISCSNCRRLTTRVLRIPAHMDVPHDAQDLCEGGALSALRYQCRHCESLIGQIASMKIRR